METSRKRAENRPYQAEDIQKKVRKNPYQAELIRNSIRKRKKEGCYIRIGSIRTGSLCIFLPFFFCSSFVWKETEKKKENSLKISKRDQDKGEKNKGKRQATWSGYRIIGSYRGFLLCFLSFGFGERFDRKQEATVFSCLFFRVFSSV